MYYPKSSEKKPPILIFVYGGGFVSGDRTRPPPLDLVFAGVGAFFAERGFLTVIPDYRLLPNMKYPDPVEDISLALDYVLQHFGDVADTNNVFLHGHSAGGMIVTSLILHQPSLLSSKQRASIKGVIPMGVAFHFRDPGPPAFRKLLEQLYGDKVDENCPCSQLEGASQEVLSSIPPLFILRSQKEPQNIIGSQDTFMKVLEEKKVTDVQQYVAEGHNHISSHLALSTGEGEEWAVAVVDWMKDKIGGVAH